MAEDPNPFLDAVAKGAPKAFAGGVFFATGSVMLGVWQWLKGRNKQLSENTRQMQEIQKEVAIIKEQMEETNKIAKKGLTLAENANKQNDTALSKQEELINLIKTLIERDSNGKQNIDT